MLEDRGQLTKSLKKRMPKRHQFLYMSPVALGRSSSLDENAIRYEFPVLWITYAILFNTIEHLGYRVPQSRLKRMRTSVRLTARG